MLRTIRKWLLWILLGLALVLIGLYALLVTTPVLDSSAERLINEFLPDGVSISFQRLGGDLIHSLSLRNVEITAPGVNGRIELLQADFDVFTFTEGRLWFKRIILHQPEFHLQPPDTTAASDAASPAPAPADTLPAVMPDSIQIPAFPVIDIQQLIIRDGKFQVDNPRHPFIASAINTEIQFYLSPEKVAISPHYFRALLDPLHIQVHNVQFRLSGTARRITLNQFEARADSSYLIGHGELEFEPHPLLYLFVDTSFVDVTLARKLVPNLEFRQGYLRLYGSYIGNPAAFKGDVFVQGVLDSLEIERLRFKYFKQGSTYRLQDFQLNSNYGQIEGQLQYSYQGRNQALLKFRNVQLNVFDIAPMPTNLNGELNFWFNRWDVKRLSGAGTVKLWHSRLGKIRLDSLQVRAGARRGLYRILKPSFVLMGGTSRFFLEGVIRRFEEGDLTLTTNRLNLEEIAHRAGLPRLTGRAQVWGHVLGPLSNPDFSLRLEMAHATVGELQLDTLHSEIFLQQIARERIGSGFLHFKSATFQKLQFKEGKLVLRSRKNRIFIDSLQVSNQETHLFVQGILNYLPRRMGLTFLNVRARYRQYALHLAKPATLLWEHDRLTVPPLRFVDNAGGEAIVEGEYDTRTTRLRGKLQSQKLELAVFQNFVEMPIRLAGRLNSRIQVEGSADTLNGTASLSIPRLMINEVPMGSIRGEVRLHNGELQLPALVFSQPTGGEFRITNLALDGVDIQTPESLWVGNRYLRGNIALEQFQLAPLSRVLGTTWPIKGHITAQMELEGNLRQPDVPVQLTVERLQVANYRFPYGTLTGRFTATQFTLDTADVNFENTLVHLSGWKKLRWKPPAFEQLFSDDRFLVRVSIEEDSLNFLGAVNEEVDRLTGDIRLHATVGGKIQEPQILDGNIRVRNGTLYLYRLANPISYIHLDAHMRGQSLVIDRLEGWSSRGAAEGNFWTRMWRRFTAPVRKLLTSRRAGEIRGNGYVDFTDLDRPLYHLTFQAHQAYVDYFLENVKAVVSTDQLQITGRDTITIAGKVQVEYGEMELNLKESEKNLLLAPTLREIPPYVAYNIELQIPGKFFIRNTSPVNTFEIQVQGDLQIIQPPREYLEVNGYLHLREGKYFVLVENFDIQEGRIEFVNPKELPEIYLVATKRKYDLLFELTVHGRINNPIKEFKIYDVRNPGEPLFYPDAKDQLALLLFGVPFAELQGQLAQKLEQKGGQMLTQAIINQIQNEARTFIGLDQIRVESAETDPIFEEARLNPQETTLALGKFLTSKLYLEFRSPLQQKGLGNIPLPELRWEAGNQLYLEYRLRHNWYLTTAYEKTLWGSDRIKFELSWQLDF